MTTCVIATEFNSAMIFFVVYALIIDPVYRHAVHQVYFSFERPPDKMMFVRVPVSFCGLVSRDDDVV